VSVTSFSDGQSFELPSARKVSNAMTSDDNRVSAEHTILVMQMGQVTITSYNDQQITQLSGYQLQIRIILYNYYAQRLTLGQKNLHNKS
jgi:hypothetical protein